MPEHVTTPLLAAIALGSNLPSSFGDREANLLVAIERIRKLGDIKAISSFQDTEPVGIRDQPRFLNAALLLHSQLQPGVLMTELLGIEAAMGRNRTDAPSKGPRIIDLDLLWVDDLVLQTEHLTLPHPAMADRAFVLRPLSEIAPHWVHPELGLSVIRMLLRLDP